MTAPIYSNAEFAAALQALLPRGRAWPREAEAVQAQTVAALAPSPRRVTDAARALLVDAFPPSTEELLPEWEESLGLPDPCAGESPDVPTRRAQVVARLAAFGGQSIAYFVALAKAIGYDITITQFTPFRFGDTFGSALNGIDWIFAWQVNAPQFTVTYFELGSSVFGEPFASWGNNVLQCEINRLAPAHTIVLFSYS
ncbi:MAG: DUF2313 domain-containing protein [Patescibacteria group bacterium]|nr:DUF2313 domain-containing protein [Patescibacteria group bacterium]